MPLAQHRELCSKMMVPDSENLARIFEMLCDEKDATLVLAMPATAQELSEKTALLPDEVNERVKELFYRGIVFESVKPHGIVYKGPRHLIQLHDASVQWPDATQEFFEVWNEFMTEEFPPLLAMMLSSGFPSFMRTIPTKGTLENFDDVLPYEDVAQMVEDAQTIAVVRCPCRLAMQKCDNPLETCIQFDRGAKYNIKRGTGRKISKEEALEIVEDAEKRGLVHTVENRAALGNVLCNCCTDCCAIIVPYLKGGEFKKILAPSRYAARIVPDQCIADEFCVDICPVGAVKMDEDGQSAVVTETECIGCGLCVSQCPSGALSLRLVRDKDFIK